MPRTAAPLKARYGSLTPLSEFRVDGKRMVRARCTCGRVTTAYLPFLNSGRVTTCGAPACRRARAAKPLKPQRGYKPRMPTGFTPQRLRRFWSQSQKVGTARLAEKFRLPLSSTYMLLDRIRRFGDVEKFIAATGAETPQ